jgi:hypothetical protein
MLDSYERASARASLVDAVASRRKADPSSGLAVATWTASRACENSARASPSLGPIIDEPSDERVQVGLLDSNPPRPNPHRAQLATADHVTDGLLVELEQIGNIGNSQIGLVHAN